jgi:hypothetical protein
MGHHPKPELESHRCRITGKLFAEVIGPSSHLYATSTTNEGTKSRAMPPMPGFRCTRRPLPPKPAPP